MRNARVLAELSGRVFGFDPENVGSIPIITAVDVTDFCSQNFLDNRHIAVVEYGRLSGGQEVLRFKTMFKDCGPNVFRASPPCAYGKKDKAEFQKFLKSSHLFLLKDWGIDLAELVKLIFENSPNSSPLPVAQT